VSLIPFRSTAARYRSTSRSGSINTAVFASRDPKAGACGSVVDILANGKFNHQVKVEYKAMPEAEALLKKFFKRLRTEPEKAKR